MHAEDGHAAVDHVHAVQGSDISNRSAAADIHLSKLRSLEKDIVVIKHPADRGDILCVGIIGPGFAAGAGELVQDNSSAKISTVLFLERVGVHRIKTGAHIGGKHTAVFQCSAK